MAPSKNSIASLEAMNARLSRAYFYGLMLILITLLVLITTTPGFAWASPTTELTPSNEAVLSDFDRIKQQHALKVAMFFEDVPPFFMHNKQGELGGIDILLAKDIAHKLDVPVKLDRSSKTFDAVVDKVVDGKADVAISLLSNTLSRATQVRFSNDYAVLRQTLLIDRLQLAQRFPTAESSKQIQTLLNQKDIKIGVISGTSYVGFVEADYPLATRALYDDFPTMIQDLQMGKIFALLYDELEIMNWRYNTPDGGLRFKIVLLNNRKDTIAFAVNRTNQDLLAWLNLYLSKIQADETLDEILTTYLEANDWRTE